MLEAANDMIRHLFGAERLSKEEFFAASAELQAEVEELNAAASDGGAPPSAAVSDARFARMLLDVLRIAHVECDTPLEYL